MLPKDVLERFLDGPFNYEERRNRVSAYVGEKLAGQEASGGAQPMDVGQVDKGRRSVSSTTNVSAHQRMIVRTWMKSEESRPDSDLFGLDWGDDPLRPSSTQ